jgi:hypothetical protein
MERSMSVKATIEEIADIRLHLQANMDLLAKTHSTLAEASSRGDSVAVADAMRLLPHVANAVTDWTCRLQAALGSESDTGSGMLRERVLSPAVAHSAVVTVGTGASTLLSTEVHDDNDVSSSPPPLLSSPAEDVVSITEASGLAPGGGAKVCFVPATQKLHLKSFANRKPLGGGVTGGYRHDVGRSGSGAETAQHRSVARQSVGKRRCWRLCCAVAVFLVARDTLRQRRSPMSLPPQTDADRVEERGDNVVPGQESKYWVWSLVVQRALSEISKDAKKAFLHQARSTPNDVAQATQTVIYDGIAPPLGAAGPAMASGDAIREERGAPPKRVLTFDSPPPRPASSSADAWPASPAVPRAAWASATSGGGGPAGGAGVSMPLPEWLDVQSDLRRLKADLAKQAPAAASVPQDVLYSGNRHFVGVRQLCARWQVTFELFVSQAGLAFDPYQAVLSLVHLFSTLWADNALARAILPVLNMQQLTRDVSSPALAARRVHSALIGQLRVPSLTHHAVLSGVGAPRSGACLSWWAQTLDRLSWLPEPVDDGVLRSIARTHLGHHLGSFAHTLHDSLLSREQISSVCSRADLQFAALRTPPAFVGAVQEEWPAGGNAEEVDRAGGRPQSSQGRGACWVCGAFDHVKKQCPKRRARTKNTNNNNKPSVSEYVAESAGETVVSIADVLAAFEADNGSFARAPLVVHAKVGASSVDVLLDTGAMVSLVTRAFAAEAGLVVSDCDASIRGVGATQLVVDGVVQFDCEIGGAVLRTSAYVLESLAFPVLLGTGALWHSDVGVTIEGRGGRVRCKVSGGAWVEAVRAVGQRRSAKARGRSRVALPLPAPVVMLVLQEGVQGSTDSEFIFQTDDGVLVVSGQFDRLPTTADEVVRILQHEPVESSVNIVTHVEELVGEAIAKDQQESGHTSGSGWQVPIVNDAEGLPELSSTQHPANAKAFENVQIGPDVSEGTRKELKRLLSRYHSVFGGEKGANAPVAPPVNTSGRCHRIVLYPGADLKSVTTSMRRLPPDEAQILRDFAEKMLAEGRLVRTHSPASNAALVVDKAGGGKRVVVDFRRLNKITIPDRRPLPLIADLQSFLAQGCLRFNFDLTSCFWQFKLAKESIGLTSTWFAADLLLGWAVAPMGLCSLPAVVQAAMSEDFDTVDTRTYIDDVLGRVDSEQQLLTAVERLLRVASEKGWTFNARKCFVGFETLEMLGVQIGTGSIGPTQSKKKKKM